MMNGYTERRRELEKGWHKCLKEYGDMSTELYEYTKKALLEFPDDETFLYRGLVNEFFIAENLGKEGKVEESYKYYKLCYEHGKELLSKCPDFYSPARFISESLNKIYMIEAGLCKHSPDDFEALVKKGRGEAVLWLREEKFKGFFREIVKKAAYNDYRYESQCSDDQAEYVYYLINEFEDPENIVNPILMKKRPYGEKINGCDYRHFVNTLAVLEKNGYGLLKNRLKEYYDELFERILSRKEKVNDDCYVDYECYDFNQTVIASVRGGAVTLKTAVNDIGKILTENDRFKMCDFEYYVIDKEFPEFKELALSNEPFIVKFFEEYKAQIDRDAELSLKNTDSAREYSDVNAFIEKIKSGKEITPRFGRKLSLKNSKTNQLIELSELALKESDVKKKWMIYSSLDVVITDPRLLVEEAKKYDYSLLLFEKSPDDEIAAVQRLARKLLDLLGGIYTNDPCIKDYAKELEEKNIPPQYMIGLKSQILAKEDVQKFIRFIKDISLAESDENDLWHTANQIALDMWDMNKGEGIPPELLYHVYRTTRCASCRARAVRLMGAYGLLSEEIREAGVYDSESEIRQICRTL